MENKLAKKMDVNVTPKFGSTLLNAAIESANEDRKIAIVNQVKALMALRETAREWERRNREAAELIEAKLAAIEKGEFELHGSTIKFNEAKLNRETGHKIVEGY